MSMDKWLSETDSKDRKKKPERNYSEKEVLDGKKRKISELIGNKPKKKEVKKKAEEISESDDFLSYFIEFRNWLNKRTYLKGDLDNIETWVKNLYSKIQSESIQELKSIEKTEKKSLIEQFKRVPPKLLDEKIRVALSKKLHGRQKTKSDNYYLRKLKTMVQEKLKEARYYEILKKILESQ
jgi:hypothetical protein